MEQKKTGALMFTLFFGVLMGALDIAIVGPAFPALRSAFNITARQLSLIFTVYVTMNLISAPLIARLSDRYGRRIMYVFSILLFVIGSVVIACASSFWMLLLGRAVQGFGAGGIFPVASAVIGDVYPPEKRGRALGIIGMVFGLAFIIGPVIGGIILKFWIWRGLFLVNVPIAIVLIVLAVRNLPHQKRSNVAPFDFLGALCIFLVLAPLSFAISQIDTGHLFSSITSVRVFPMFIVSLAALFMLRLAEHRAKDPIVRPSLVEMPQIFQVNMLSFAAGFIESAIVFLPLLAVSAFAVSNSTASFLILPLVVATAVGSPLVGRLLDAAGAKKVILIGTLILASGLFIIAFLGTLFAFFIAGSVIMGFGLITLLGAPLRYIVLREARLEDRAVAQGVLAIFGGTGQLVGGALLAAFIASAHTPLGGYMLAYAVAAACAVLSFIVSIFLHGEPKRTAKA